MKENKRVKIHLDSFEEYRTSVLRYIEEMLQQHYKEVVNVGIADIKKDEKEINAYVNYDFLEPIREKDIIKFDDKTIDTKEATEAILSGKILWEHTAAGEATRLGLGTKYLLNLSQFTTEEIVGHMRSEIEAEIKKGKLTNRQKNNRKEELNKITEENIMKEMGDSPGKLKNLSLGNRHMLQMVFDLKKLAEKEGYDVKKVMATQTILVVLNEKTAEEIIDEFKRYNFFGLNPEKVYFMVQRSFHGIYIKEGVLFYDKTTEKNKRLHNHGQLAMQKIHSNVFFRVNPGKTNKRNYITKENYENILKNHLDVISYNIEDLIYLNNSLDLASIALALKLAKQGYGMVMEIVANNPIKPQKGGACFYDKKIKRAVMIESNQLKDIKNNEIKHLNKNFNHYLNPIKVHEAIKKKGLPMSFEVKDSYNQWGDSQAYIYPCFPQGDINFLVKTAYVMRKNIKPISNWKSAITTPATVKAMFQQDQQEGFSEFIKSIY